MSDTASAATRPRLVLDTNVVLDLIVFRDAGVTPLAAALASGRAHCVVNAEGLAELALVLARPRFGLDAADRAALIAGYRAMALEVPSGSAAAVRLPRCRDPDDQKFLELARDATADYLVTKDKALLRLNRARHGLARFRILTPAALAALLAADQPAGPMREMI